MIIDTKFSIGDYISSKDYPFRVFKIASIVIYPDYAITYYSVSHDSIEQDEAVLLKEQT